jgi:protein MpaA
MAKRLLLVMALVLATSAIAPGAASAGAGLTGAAGGVTVSGLPYRYVAISPGFPRKLTPHALTVVERIDRRNGKVDRWWYLKGFYYVPAVAYDGSGGGLSADGRTLVLSRFSTASPRRTTRLAILRTDLYLRHPVRPGQHRPRHAISRVTLHGAFSVDAISPDGSTVFLTHQTVHLIHRSRPPRAGSSYATTYEVRALDTASGRLLPRPIGDPTERGERMAGLPISRATSPDGRWAYTLYDDYRKVPFIEALDTVGRRAIHIALPGLPGKVGRNLFLLKLLLKGGGRKLVVLRWPATEGGRPRQILSIETKNLETRKPAPTATASRFLSFAQTPRFPGNLLGRAGIAGRSAAGRPIEVHQLGDPAIAGKLLIVGCIHGDECAASGIEPLHNGCPDPKADIYVVPNLNPDGAAEGTRLNGRGVDLNRNFPSGWKPIGSRGDPQYSGPRPYSEPETRLAGRIVHQLQPKVTVWFHQHHASRPLVRAWGQSAPAARHLARMAKLPFHLLPWPAGTAPNWQNHHFPGTSSFVVELPPGRLSDGLRSRLSRSLDRLGREVGKD